MPAGLFGTLLRTLRAALSIMSTDLNLRFRLSYLAATVL